MFTYPSPRKNSIAGLHILRHGNVPFMEAIDTSQHDVSDIIWGNTDQSDSPELVQAL
jgi:hypothetical protein